MLNIALYCYWRQCELWKNKLQIIIYLDLENNLSTLLKTIPVYKKNIANKVNLVIFYFLYCLKKPHIVSHIIDILVPILSLIINKQNSILFNKNCFILNIYIYIIYTYIYTFIELYYRNV